VSSISSWEIRSPRDALPVADVDLDVPVLGDGSRRLLFSFLVSFFLLYGMRAPFRWSRDERNNFERGSYWWKLVERSSG